MRFLLLVMLGLLVMAAMSSCPKPDADEEGGPASGVTDDNMRQPDYAPPTESTAPPADETVPPAEGVVPPAEGETPPADGVTPPAEGETPPVEGETPPVEGETPPAEPPAEGGA